MSEFEIEIDGKKLKAKPNDMIIQVADEAGIYIPRFCYHKHLSIAANCRMCLVEVEKSGKPLPACATPVMPDMKVFTKSSKALAAQKAVMEFLLINHPLDCPICDQGGECELQDLAMGYGSADSFYNEGKRTFKDKDIGPLISTDMTRCIQCTRCVRFGAEIAGMRELGALGRGGELEIGTYIDHAMKSEVSGNVIDICPVGALTSKPFRFSARAWELQQRPSISVHDCVGTNVNVHTRNGKVMRIVPRENTTINETWIADRDRYSYQALAHEDRLTKPLIKKNGKWQEAEWEVALEFAVGGLQKTLSASSADQLGALASPSASLEEFYLFQKLVRGIGSPNIDHRLRRVDFTDQAQEAIHPGLGMSLAELEQAGAVLLVGSNIQREQPIASLRLRKASLRNSAIMAVNVVDYDFSFDVKAKQIVEPDVMVFTLAKIANALLRMGEVKLSADTQALLAAHLPGSEEEAIAKTLLDSENAVVLLGAVALNHPEASTLKRVCHVIAALSKARVGLLTEGANAAGAYLAGMIPHRGVAGAALQNVGLDAQAMLKNPRKAYLLLNVEPDLDVANPVLMQAALQQAEMVIALSTYKNPILLAHAHVILPIAAFTESAGTYVNASGAWQAVTGVANHFEEARPAWKVLRVLGNLLKLEGFDYHSAEEVSQQMQLHCVNLPSNPEPDLKLPEKFKQPSEKLIRIGTVPLYSVDNIVRRAPALQAAQTILEGKVDEIRLHPDTAARLHLEPGKPVTIKQKQGEARLTVALDARLPLRGAYVAAGIAATQGLSELIGEIEVE